MDDGLLVPDDLSRQERVVEVEDELEAGGEPLLAAERRAAASSAVRSQIRGSSLLLVGRVLSMGTALVTQLLAVHHLSKADYGDFIYVVTLATTATTVVTFGMDQAMFRFVPIYDERRQHGNVVGLLLIYTGTVLSLGSMLVLLGFGLRGAFEGALPRHEETARLVVVLVFLAPIQSLSQMLEGMLAIFAGAKAIFWRRHVLTPGLRITAVLLLVISDGGPRFLAVGYVLTGLAGVLVYAAMLLRVLRAKGVWARWRSSRPRLALRELYGFSAPILLNDIVLVVVGTTGTVLLGRSHGAEEVAAYRAILPYAALNTFVLASFALLFNPAAARMYARGDREGIAHLYWQTAAWVAVLSFPVFAATFSMARPLVEILLPPRYSSSAPLLAIVSFGSYVQAASGFNGQTLKVFGLVRYSVVITFAAAAFNLVVVVLLVPAHGPMGAAIAACATYLVHNTLKQAGLARGTGISLFDRGYASIYAWIGAGALGLLFVQTVVRPPSLVGLALAAGVSALVLYQGRSRLSVSETFPELRKIPFVRRLV